VGSVRNDHNILYILLYVNTVTRECFTSKHVAIFCTSFSQLPKITLQTVTGIKTYLLGKLSPAITHVLPLCKLLY